MPNNYSPDDLNSMFNRINQRMSRLENSPQIGNSSIQAGGLQILDPNGKIVAVFGYQQDGSIGMATYNPVTGSKTTQIGILPDGSEGLAIYDPSTSTKVVQLGEINASPVQYGLVVQNSSGVLQQVAGSTVQVIATAVSTSGTGMQDLGGPYVTTNVGPSGDALVTAVVNVSAVNAFGAIAVAIDGSIVVTSVNGATIGIQGGTTTDIFSVSGMAVISEIFSGLTPGSHTFAIWYQEIDDPGYTAQQVQFGDRTLVVTPY